MSLESLLQLVLLALIDSTSIGTLVIPLWLLLRKNSSGMGAKVAAYLGILGLFYFGIGIALLLGAQVVLNAFSTSAAEFADAPWVRWLATIIGVVLIIWGFTDSKATRAAKKKAADKKASELKASANRSTLEANSSSETERRQESQQANPQATTQATPQETPQPGASTWAPRIDRALQTRAGLVSLALIAGVLELPTMLPYLAAVGILANASIGVVPSVGLLALYCLVMLAPALVLLAARLGFKDRIDPMLAKLSSKLSKWAADAAKWIAAIVGILIVRWAVFTPGSPVLEILKGFGLFTDVSP